MMKYLILALAAVSTDAFVGRPIAFRQARQVVYISEETARMIDKALWRQNHKGELEEAWKVRNSVVIEKELPKEYAFDDHFMEDTYTPRQYRKDKSMARKDPIAYCADRCVATGNCDIFEEIFDMSPEEVLKFCNDCVMSESEDPCDVPDAVWEKGFYNLRP